jgi:hypothetical protein
MLLLDIVTADDIMNNLIQKEEELQEEEQTIEGIPICGANLSSPVTETAQYIKEIHYKIGNRLYIENAD